MDEPFDPFQVDWAARGVHPSELISELLEEDAWVLLNDLAQPAEVRWDRLPDDELEWVAFEVLDDVPVDNEFERVRAEQWWSAFGDAILGAAFQHGAQDFSVNFRSWGLVFDVAFHTEAHADAFRSSITVINALEQLGALRLVVSRGRGGGTAGTRSRRRPRPLLGSGSAELPLPEPDRPFAFPERRELVAC